MKEMYGGPYRTQYLHFYIARYKHVGTVSSMGHRRNDCDSNELHFTKRTNTQGINFFRYNTFKTLLVLQEQ